MIASLKRMSKAVRSFHEDEEGMETIQVVMLVAIAALVLITIKMFWGKIKQWATGNVDKAAKDD